ncbi:MAG: F0F1 ATP synthase subunit epsilon [Candidatus Aminicenantales bacterium]
MSGTAPARLHLRIVTSRALLVETDADEVQIPTIDGLIGVYPEHRPLIVALGRGTLAYRQAKYEERFDIDGGYAEIGPESVLIFTESAPPEE